MDSVSIPLWFDSNDCVNCINCNKDCVSIPLWFDSNSKTVIGTLVMFGLNSTMVRFKSDQQRFSLYPLNCLNSTMVRFKCYSKTIGIKIGSVSIPLWFDSNKSLLTDSQERLHSRSQFHYGSIQMVSIRIERPVPS